MTKSEIDDWKSEERKAELLALAKETLEFARSEKNGTARFGVEGAALKTLRLMVHDSKTLPDVMTDGRVGMLSIRLLNHLVSEEEASMGSESGVLPALLALGAARKARLSGEPGVLLEEALKVMRPEKPTKTARTLKISVSPSRLMAKSLRDAGLTLEAEAVEKVARSRSLREEGERDVRGFLSRKETEMRA